MSTAIWILLLIVALGVGVFGGIFIARKQIEKEIGEHPRLTPEAIREMMSQMGQNQVKQKSNKLIVISSNNQKQPYPKVKIKANCYRGNLCDS